MVRGLSGPSTPPHTAPCSPAPAPGASPRGGLFPPDHLGLSLALLLTPTRHQQVWALPSRCAALGAEQGPRGEVGETELPRRGLGPSNKPPLPAPVPGRCWPSGQVSGEGGLLCRPRCPSMWVTVGTGLLQLAGPWALVKKRATYKNIYILTPYKLLTIDTQTAAEGECTQQGHRRGNNLGGEDHGRGRFPPRSLDP